MNSFPFQFMNKAISIIKNVLPYSQRKALKRIHRRLRNLLNKQQASLPADVFESLLADLRVSKGDTVIVTSSFANLNVQFSPDDLLNILIDIIGPDGNIIMPFYPPGNSEEWVRSGKVFDMHNTPSSMGVLTQKLSERKGALKSKHPFKAVVAWGKDAADIVGRHHLSVTPFDDNSPYGWLLNHPSKSLGLGAKNNPAFHACEDFLAEHHCNLYLDEEFTALVKVKDEIIPIKTYVHNSKVMDTLLDIGDYIPRLNLPSYRRCDFGYSFSYSLCNQELLERCKVEFTSGRFRYK